MVDKSHVIRMVLLWSLLAVFTFPFPTLAGENPGEIIAGIPKDFPPYYSGKETINLQGRSLGILGSETRSGL